MKIGTRIYYHGDSANMPSYGTVTAYHPATAYTPEGVTIVYDEERFEFDPKITKLLPLSAFEKGCGLRFEIIENKPR